MSVPAKPESSPQSANNRWATTPPEWKKPSPICLEKKASVDEAISVIVRGSLTHFNDNLAAAIDGRNPEGVHQVRVSMRRLRSALAIFRRYIPSEQRDWIKQEAKWLVKQLGPARDLDVFIQELTAPFARKVSEDAGLARMMATARAQRLSAYEAVKTALESARTRRFANRLETWVEGCGWQIPDVTGTNADKGREKASVFARKHINRRIDKLRSVYSDIEALDVEERHELRKDIKKIRYGLEFFSSVLPAKKTVQLVSSLKSLQDTLGHLNDLEVSERTISGLSLADRSIGHISQVESACAEVRELHRAAAEKAEPETAKLWRKFLKIPAI